MSVAALARQNGGPPQRGHSGGGGRVDLDFFLHEKSHQDNNAFELIDYGVRAGVTFKF